MGVVLRARDPELDCDVIRWTLMTWFRCSLVGTTRATAMVLVLAAAGCGPGSAPSSGTAATPVNEHAGAMAALGTVVRIAGSAADAKLSAVVDTGILHVYCLDLSHWPADRLGKPVVVEGMLEHTAELESYTTSTGLVAQGGKGRVFVIRRCAIR